MKNPVKEGSEEEGPRISRITPQEKVDQTATVCIDLSELCCKTACAAAKELVRSRCRQWTKQKLKPSPYNLLVPFQGSEQILFDSLSGALTTNDNEAAPRVVMALRGDPSGLSNKELTRWRKIGDTDQGG